MTDRPLETQTGNSAAAGIVLCGGQSSRMGQPKHLLEFAGKTMLQRVVGTLLECTGPVVVVASPGQTMPDLPHAVEVVYDAEQFRGPLAGLKEGLSALAGRAELAYATACDTPLLRPEFVRAMIATAADYDLAICQTGKFLNPLAAVYRTHLVEPINGLLKNDRMRPVFLLECCRSVIVDAEQLRSADPRLDSLRNANSPEDYAELLSDWEARHDA